MTEGAQTGVSAAGKPMQTDALAAAPSASSAPASA
jgi:hypothetical protein